MFFAVGEKASRWPASVKGVESQQHRAAVDEFVHVFTAC
jgi:hypothetical protein